MKIPLVFKVLLLGILPMFLLTFFFLSLLQDKPSFQTIDEEMIYWEKRDDKLKVATCLLRSVEANKKSFRCHADFMRYYTGMTYRERELILPDVKKLLGEPEKYYLSLKKSSQRDIGLYALALLTYSRQYTSEYAGLLLSLDSISSDTLPFVNELKGDILNNLSVSGVDFYWKEWKMYGNNQSNYQKLLVSLVQQKRYRDLVTLLKFEGELPSPIPVSLKHYIAFHTNIELWLRSIYDPIWFSLVSTEGTIAFLIFLVWIILVWQADIFGEMSWAAKTKIIIFSAFFSPLCMTFYDFFYYYLEWNGGFFLVREIMVTGLVEETTKFIPVLLCWYFFPRSFSTPLSLFVASSFSSLMFSFQENILYFAHYYDLSIASGRAILSSTLHLVTGSVLIYGVIMVKHAGRSWIWIPLCFLIAITTHGFYNFFLGSGFAFVSVIMVIAGVFSWGSMLNNCLNNSPLFNNKKNKIFVHQSIWCITGLSTIVLVEFILNSINSGFENGSLVFSESLLKCAWIIPVLALSFQRLDLEQGQWRFIDFGGFREVSLFGPTSGKKIIGISPSGNHLMAAGTSFTATVNKRIRSAEDETWYLIETDHPELPMALIRFKEYGANFYDFNVYVYLRKVESIPLASFKANDHAFIGFIMISPHIDNKMSKTINHNDNFA